MTRKTKEDKFIEELSKFFKSIDGIIANDRDKKRAFGRKGEILIKELRKEFDSPTFRFTQPLKWLLDELIYINSLLPRLNKIKHFKTARILMGIFASILETPALKALSTIMQELLDMYIIADE